MKDWIRNKLWCSRDAPGGGGFGGTWSHSAQSGLSGQSLIPVCVSASQFPFQVGLMVAVTMSSLVSLSRLYTGMHSVLVKYSRHVHVAAFWPRAGLIMHIFMFPCILSY